MYMLVLSEAYIFVAIFCLLKIVEGCLCYDYPVSPPTHSRTHSFIIHSIIQYHSHLGSGETFWIQTVCTVHDHGKAEETF